MSDSITTATPETKNAAPTAHPPVRENQIKAEVDRSQVAGQRVMRSIGGGSPEAPPEKFTGTLGGGSGGLWRQMQRSYGNQYVGQVIQRKCDDCEKKEEKIQRKGEGDVSAVPDGFEAAMQQSGSGQPLDDGNRSFMESRFGQDFGDVKVHTDSAAAEASQQIQAQAFTTGRDIYFGRGRYQPQATEGKKLLAHELTHVVQQNTLSDLQFKRELSSPNDPMEQVADDIAAKVVSENGSQIKANSSFPTTSAIQRQPEYVHDPGSDRSEQYEALQPGQPEPSGGGTGYGMNFRGICRLRSGTMKYSLEPRVGLVHALIEFVPNAIVAKNSRTISFIQTVATFSLNKKNTVNIEVDKLEKDRDPFYGAQWNVSTGKWGSEPDFPGSRPFTPLTGSAMVVDDAKLNLDEGKQFNTVAIVVETGEVLGSLSWNIQRFRAWSLWKIFSEQNDSSTIVKRAQCVEGTSADFQTVVENFYSGDENVVLDGFTAGIAELSDTHIQKLTPIVDRLRKTPNKRVIVGGAATQDEANPSVLSRLRADKVQAYLIGQGINDTRIEVESYGADWARVPITSPGAANTNRRVQIRIIK